MRTVITSLMPSEEELYIVVHHLPALALVHRETGAIESQESGKKGDNDNQNSKETETSDKDGNKNGVKENVARSTRVALLVSVGAVGVGFLAGAGLILS